MHGEVTDPAAALSNWPLPATADQAATVGSHSNAADEKKEEKDAKLTKGRKVAVARFIGEKNAPELTVSMLHELPMFYRVDLPNDRTGEQIYNDLTAHLTRLRDNQDHWPSTVLDAQRVVTRCAVEAVYGVPVPAAK
jgi:hypothetical protein